MESDDDYIAGKGQNSLLHFPAWKLDKVKSKKEVVEGAQKNNNKVHFASFMHICHRKNAELTKDDLCFEEIVKYDTRAYAVLLSKRKKKTGKTDGSSHAMQKDGQAAV